MTAPTVAADSPAVDLRDPIVAVVLAFLVPGLGHLYQRRLVKAAIYFVCVLGLFGWGMSMAEGQCVSFRPPTGENVGNRKEFIHYLGQVGCGLVTLPAIVQYRRYVSPENSTFRSDGLEAPFVGTYRKRRTADGLPDDDLELIGTIRLAPTGAQFGGMRGEVVARTGDAAELRIPVEDVDIEKPLENHPRRALAGLVLTDSGVQAGSVDGSVPRPLADRYLVPLSSEAEQRINAELGTRFDLAAVITMIAGLLNFLAMYDAYAGPAYGYDASLPEEPGDPTSDVPSAPEAA